MFKFLADITNTIYNYFASMSDAEFFSTLVIVATAVFFIIAERIWPYTKGQKVLREGFFDDLALYTVAQSYILGILIFTYIINFIDSSTGLSRLKLFENVPIWIQLVFFLITHDIYIYWMHRWHHSTGKGRNRNFATKLAIWDWVFGTAYFPETKPDEYGLKTHFPNHYLMQTVFAFRPFKRSKQAKLRKLEAK